MISAKCKRRMRTGLCALLSPEPQGIRRSILAECAHWMVESECPLFQEYIDPAVLAVSIRASVGSTNRHDPPRPYR